MVSIYDRINRELKARKMTRRELAARAGINESTLGSLFHRKSEYFPTKYTKAIAKVFDMPWEDLAGYVRETAIDEHGNVVHQSVSSPKFLKDTQAQTFVIDDEDVKRVVEALQKAYGKRIGYTSPTMRLIAETLMGGTIEELMQMDMFELSKVHDYIDKTKEEDSESNGTIEAQSPLQA